MWAHSKQTFAFHKAPHCYTEAYSIIHELWDTLLSLAYFRMPLAVIKTSERLLKSSDNWGNHCERISISPFRTERIRTTHGVVSIVLSISCETLVSVFHMCLIEEMPNIWSFNQGYILGWALTVQQIWF